MKYVLVVLSLVVGFALGFEFHKPQTIQYSAQSLDVQKALASGGLLVPCRVPYTLEYCVTHPEAQ